MEPPRRLKILTPAQLRHLTKARLLAYRKKALSLENSPEESDYSPKDVAALDDSYIWFKSDPRWRPLYDRILSRLADVQSRRA